MPLREYRRKRDFTATREPAAGGRRGRRIFVVQLHHASHRHYDFRLEVDGVLKSWAVPKGPSLDPKVKRLAVEVEDHPLAYAGFEGDIAPGNYGAGRVDVFDRGTWEAVGDGARAGLAQGELKFELHGDVLRGSWVLVRTRKVSGRQHWLLIKHRDAYAGTREADDFVDPRSDRPLAPARRKAIWKDKPHAALAASRPARTRRLPAGGSARAIGTAETLRAGAFAPELCRAAATPPGGDAWLHETKWDGYRLLASVRAGKARLWSRNGIEWSARVPELVDAIESLGLRSALIDGEMVVLRKGRDDFNALQGRLATAARAPAVYVLFDLPHIDGRSLRKLPLLQRKQILAEVLERHPHRLLRFSAHTLGHGERVFARATAAGREGIVSKRIDRPYVGARNGDWLKVKARPSDEFVVVGFTEPKGSRAGVGALLLAKPLAGGLVYVGRVGTGIDAAQLRALRRQLDGLRIDTPAADIERMARKDRALAIWTEPTLIVEVFFQGIGSQGLLRQPAFKALRPDKTLADLVAPARVHKPQRARRSAQARAAKPRAVRRGAAAPDTHVRITHPERVVFARLGASKADVAAYYRAVAPRMLTEIAGRPLAVLRCPDGAAKACFFQKHLAGNLGKHVHGVAIRDSSGMQQYLYVDDALGLLELVQMNAIEFHPWGARVADPDAADRVVFDLDPHAGVAWPRVVAAARALRRRLEALGLASFVRTTGGKGLHVVVPLDPPAPWPRVREFARAFATQMAQRHADEFVATAGEEKRQGRIFIDWLRNARGATAVASYSWRARADAGVAMPLAWSQLGTLAAANAFTIANAARALARRRDPWQGIDRLVQSLPDAATLAGPPRAGAGNSSAAGSRSRRRSAPAKKPADRAATRARPRRRAGG
jgi:bifunctional non-homologous end joining protein LigD